MPKNIVICCDGTGNHIRSYPSNVLHLFTTSLKSKDQQVCFYNPGLGTMPLNPDGSSEFRKTMTITRGLAFGYGIERDIRNAYSFLVNHYHQGDKIFLFGFSRGAYTVRVLAGFLHLYGLMDEYNSHLFDYAFDSFGKNEHSHNKNNIFRNAHNFSKRFSSSITIHFMGLWDTVSSVGWVSNFRSFPYTNVLKNVRIVRHALAYHETRVYYKPVHVTKDTFIFDHDQNTKLKQDLQEVWFAGVHSDIGGSYQDDESGLAMIPFNWMISEATKFGLKIVKTEYEEVMRPHKHPKLWKRKNILHNSVTGLFWVMELFPRKRPNFPPQAALHFGYKTRRKFGADDEMHESCQMILYALENKQEIEEMDLSRYYKYIEFVESNKKT